MDSRITIFCNVVATVVGTLIIYLLKKYIIPFGNKVICKIKVLSIEITPEQMEKFIRMYPNKTGIERFDILVDRYKKGISAQDTSDGPRVLNPIADDYNKAHDLMSKKDRKLLYRKYIQYCSEINKFRDNLHSAK